jgi:hypothetical protein
VLETLDRGDVRAVGATVRPQQAHLLERIHWSLLNAICLWEARASTSGTVMAPCYLFARALLPAGFPEDDVHVALATLREGARVGFVAADVRELRSPERVATLFTHKLRKADAYVRELLRFGSSWALLPPRARRIVALRLFQVFVVAPAVVPGLALSLAAVIQASGPAGSLALFAAAVLASLTRPGRLALGGVALLALLGVVLPVTLLRYPFWQQTATIPKVNP